ncbi:MAG: hypothetical protein WA688_07525 [Thermoplasmata archaeon]
MGEELDSLEQSLLRHLLTYRGHQVRFEADAHTTEFGIYRSFTDLEAGVLKTTLRQLENGRWIYRRVQYVIGFSEPKLVYSLTPNGYRKALDLFGSSPGSGLPAPPGPASAAPTGPTPESTSSPPAPPRKSPPHRRERPDSRPKKE